MAYIYDATDNAWHWNDVSISAASDYTPDPTKVLFVGDYSTNNFSQWDTVQNKLWNSSGAGYDALPPGYPAQVSTDTTYGHAARFEVRDGDVPNFGGGERSEVQGETAETGGEEGDLRWYEWATKFDATWPNNHASLGWGLVNQWHDNGTGLSPVGWYVDQVNDKWSLLINKQSSPTVFVAGAPFSIIDLPLKRGVWQHISMRILWSTSDGTGSVKAWLDGNPLTFTNGSTTFNVRTLVPGSGSSVYYKQGYYRNASMTVTGIVSHTAFRACTDATGLTVQVS